MHPQRCLLKQRTSEYLKVISQKQSLSIEKEKTKSIGLPRGILVKRSSQMKKRNTNAMVLDSMRKNKVNCQYPKRNPKRQTLVMAGRCLSKMTVSDRSMQEVFKRYPRTRCSNSDHSNHCRQQGKYIGCTDSRCFAFKGKSLHEFREPSEQY